MRTGEVEQEWQVGRGSALGGHTSGRYIFPDFSGAVECSVHNYFIRKYFLLLPVKCGCGLNQQIII